MTKRFLVSVKMEKGAPLRFAAVALGSYPTVLIGMSLSGKKEWKQVSGSDGSFYLWNKANLQLSLPSGGVLLAANGDMPDSPLPSTRRQSLCPFLPKSPVT